MVFKRFGNVLRPETPPYRFRVCRTTWEHDFRTKISHSSKTPKFDLAICAPDCYPPPLKIKGDKKYFRTNEPFQAVLQSETKKNIALPKRLKEAITITIDETNLVIIFEPEDVARIIV